MSTAARVDILIDIKARLDELLKSQEAFRQMKDQATSFGTMFKTGLGIDFARRAVDLFKGTVVDAVRSSSALASEIERAGNRLNVSAEGYQTLAHEARRAGTEFTEMLSSLNAYRAGLGAALLDPRKGSVFSQLGLDAERLSGMPLERATEATAIALGNVADANIRARLQQELFGRSASALTPVLERLRVQGYDKLKDSASAAALILDTRMAAALNGAQTSVQEAQKRLSVALAPINLRLLQARAGATDFLARNAGSLASGVEAGFAAALAHALTTGLEKAAATAERQGGWRKAGERLGTLLAGPAGVAFATAIGGYIIKELERKKLASIMRADAFDASAMGNVSGIHKALPLVESDADVMGLHNRAVAALESARAQRKAIIQTPGQSMTDEKRDNFASLEREIAALERLIPLIKMRGSEFARANAAARVDFLGIHKAQLAIAGAELDLNHVMATRRPDEEKRQEEIKFLKFKADKLADIIALTKRLPATAMTTEERERQLLQLRGDMEAAQDRAGGLALPDSQATTIGKQFKDFAGGKDAAGGNLLTGAGEGLTAGLQQWAMQTGTIGQQVASTFTNTIGGAVSNLSGNIMGLITKTKSLGDVGREMGAMFVQALIQMIVQAMAFAAVIAILNAIAPGSGTAAAAFFSQSQGRASGGPVAVGQPYIVGEHRPEVFVPTVPGSIVPSVDSYRVMSRRAGGGSAMGGAAAGVGPVAGKPHREIWVVGDMFSAKALARDQSWDNEVIDTFRRHRGDMLDGAS